MIATHLLPLVVTLCTHALPAPDKGFAVYWIVEPHHHCYIVVFNDAVLVQFQEAFALPYRVCTWEIDKENAIGIYRWDNQAKRECYRIPFKAFHLAGGRSWRALGIECGHGYEFGLGLHHWWVAFPASRWIVDRLPDGPN